jgi:hypothetical protein
VDDWQERAEQLRAEHAENLRRIADATVRHRLEAMTLAVDWGAWCDYCLLPSACMIWTLGIADGRAYGVWQKRWCPDCGRTAL